MRYKAVPAPRSERDREADAATGADAVDADGADRAPGLDDLAAVRDALPRVPRPESDCCARIARRVDWIENREAAREWLVFLRALGLAARSSGGDYVRAGSGSADASDELDRERLGERFRSNVLGASAVLDALLGEDGDTDAERAPDAPFDLDDAFAAVEPAIPAWERQRSDDWEAAWREHVERVLAWCVRLGLAERDGDAYVATDRALDAGA